MMTRLRKPAQESGRFVVPQHSHFASRHFAQRAEEHEAPAAKSPVPFSLADIDIFPRETVQPKLWLGPVGDRYEEEADQMAGRVVQIISSPDPGPVQRQEDLKDEDELDLEEDGALQRKVAGPAPSTRVADLGPEFDSSIQRARLGGKTLPDSVRLPMERAFGADFGGVRIHADEVANRLNRSIQARAFTTGQDVFLRQGEYRPGSFEGQRLLAHELTHVVQQNGSKMQKENVIQRYMLYNPGAGAGQYQTNGGADFTSQITGGAGNSFIDPGTQLPRLQNQVNPPAVRVSQNGHLAIEDAQLTNRQPKFFYANVAMVPAWNDTLQSQGSFYRLVVVGGPILTFVMPGGDARHLAKIEARNLERGNQGLGMTTAQRCDEMVREVLGTIGTEPKALFNNAPMQLPEANQVTQEIIRHYYVAAELAYEAAGGGGAGAGGAWGVGGMPVNGVDFSNSDPVFNAVAANYGNEMNLHLGAVPNAALAARMQFLGVNEYAAPEVGQGLVTHKLGKETAAPGAGGGTQLIDAYNNRVVPNPNNNTMWGFHWAGVIAKDGTDYITIENYARNAEDNHLPLSPADPRFYFQMYGADAQSWHAQWSAIGRGGREFVNPVSMVVAAEETPEVYEERAMRNFGNNIYAIRYDYNTLAVVGATDDQLRIGLLKGLAYAKYILDNNVWGNQGTVNAWVTAVTNVANPAVTALRDHVLARLGQIWRIPIVGL